MPKIRIAKENTLVPANSSLRRISVHADAVHVDLAVPAQLSIATLLPAIVDIVAARGYRRDHPTAAPYQLTRPAVGALDASKTLAQHGILDGAVLVVTRPADAPPAPRYDDAAEAVGAAVHTVTHPWTPRTGRLCRAVVASWLAAAGAALLVTAGIVPSGGRNLAAATGVAAGAAGVAVMAAVIAYRARRDPLTGAALSLWASGFAAVAGFLAVPGGPGPPNALLAAMAAAAVSALVGCLAGCGSVAVTAVSGLAVLVAVAMLAAVAVRVPLQVIGAVTAAVAVGLLQAAGWVSVAAAGLAPRLDTAPPTNQLTAQTIRAHGTLTSLVVALSVAAALGAIGAVVGVHGTGPPRTAGLLFAAVIGAALVLRARTHTDRRQVVALLAAGTAAVGAAAVAAAAAVPHGSCVAAAGLVAAALCICCVPAPSWSPVLHRVGERAEYLTLAALVPLTCWVCGLFGAARSMALL
ncbi:type VII secretion integral membrane protein EccD [Mycobacterium sp. pUA109]|uniref:type VII secretion integral membrane protein EccD n=1 Tax=Mycobacterium sp. pUA109 TaxID=3238982 RepID=UPI00351BBCB2